MKINGNSALHFFVLGMVLAVLPLVHHWFLALDAFIWAALREQAQHRYILDYPIVSGDKILYEAKKRTFFDFGWLGKKQWQEIMETTLGAVLLLGAYEIYLAYGTRAIQ
jgi:hypothetical protein